MNEQLKSEVFHGACPHDCPDTCAMVYEVHDGKLVDVRGNKDHPDDARRSVREAQGLPRPPRQSRSPDVSAAPHRSEGFRSQFERITWEEAISEIGRRWREIIAEYGSQAIMPLQLSRQHGPRAGHQLRRPVLQSPRHDGERKDVLRVGLVDRVAADRRPDRRRRSRKLRALRSSSSSGPATPSRPTCTIGPSCSKRRSAAPRSSSSTRYRSRTAKAADWHICPKPGTDGALAMGFINSIIEQGLVDQDYVDKHTYGYPELKARAAEFSPEYVEKVTGVKAADIRQVRERIRNRAAVGHPHRRRARTLSRRRPGDPRRLCAARPRRLVEACRRRPAADAAVGLPRRLGQGLARPTGSSPARASSTTCASVRRSPAK